MTNPYLTPDHPDAFVDFPDKSQRRDHYLPHHTIECPVCKGNGGWNLRLNAYPLREGVEDTPENRHKFVHFRAGCSQCTGWGWVGQKDAECIHEWQDTTIGNCLHLWTCTKCGCKREVDTSG